MIADTAVQINRIHQFIKFCDRIKRYPKILISILNRLRNLHEDSYHTF